MYRNRTPRSLRQAPELIEARIKQKQSRLEELQNSCNALEQELGDVNAAEVVKKHVRLLHEYNEIRDVAMGLINMIADQRKIRIQDVMEEMCLDISE